MSKIRSAILPAAGLGTRMLPFTKEIPKEMLPVADLEGGRLLVKPALHYIFDALFEVGVRRFYFIVGRGKRVIEDYFTPDWGYVELLERMGKAELAETLSRFYRRLEKCEIVVVNQPAPLGFGDAVLRTKPFMVDEEFIVHAGDEVIYPSHSSNIARLIEHFNRLGLSAAMLYTVSDKPHLYGVIVGDELSKDVVKVRDVLEKPREPPSRRIVVAVYVFTREVYRALEETRPVNGEHQLTDAIRWMLRRGAEIHAVRVQGLRLDLGTPENYFTGVLRALEGLQHG